MKKLKIDPGFKNLIRPLFRAEYLQLEANILADGCRDPIIVWRNTIVDGHNRYEICTKHNVPFETKTINFSCRDEAVAWICANQLGRRNISDETRKFLIGKQYEASKALTINRNVLGNNQYVSSNIDNIKEQPIVYSKYGAAQKIADENHISHGTVEKYAAYSRAIDDIEKKEPALVPKILSGKYKFSHNSILDLSKRSKAEVKNINKRLESIEKPFAQYQTTRMEVNRDVPDDTKDIQPSVKDMPQYDPDAEITSLAITIPSWISSIERLQTHSDMEKTSRKARERLRTVLLDMQKSIATLLQIIEED